MITTKKNFFNLAEIVISLGIIAFGVTSIMSVFPAALKNTQDSIGENYSSNAASIFFSYFTLEAKNNDWQIVTGLDAEKPFVNFEPGVDDRFDKTNFGTENFMRYINVPHYKMLEESKRKKGVFRITQGEDFTAVARVWRTEKLTDQMGDAFIMGEDLSEMDQQYLTGIYVEISWPFNRPYSRREKKVYYREISNPNFKANGV